MNVYTPVAGEYQTHDFYKGYQSRVLLVSRLDSEPKLIIVLAK
jgi:hypothetical protein